MRSAIASPASGSACSPAGREDDERGDCDPDGGREVGEDMTERRLNVEVLLGGSREDPRRREVHAAARSPATRSIQPPRTCGGSSRRRIASTKTQIAIATSARPFASAARISARRKPKLRSGVAGPGREPGRAERERERRGVAEHVARVREQRQAAGQEPADDLGPRVGDGQGKNEPERSPAAGPVRVVVRVRHLRRLDRDRPLKSLYRWVMKWLAAIISASTTRPEGSTSSRNQAGTGSSPKATRSVTPFASRPTTRAWVCPVPHEHVCDTSGRGTSCAPSFRRGSPIASVPMITDRKPTPRTRKLSRFGAWTSYSAGDARRGPK